MHGNRSSSSSSVSLSSPAGVSGGGGARAVNTVHGREKDEGLISAIFGQWLFAGDHLINAIRSHRSCFSLLPKMPKKSFKNPRNKLHPSSSFFLVLLLLCNLEMPTSGEEIPLFSAKSECVCLCSSLFFSPSWYHYRSCLPLSGGVGGMCLFAAQAHQPTQNQPRPLLSLVYFCSSSFSSRVFCGAVPNMMQSPLSLNKLPN